MMDEEAQVAAIEAISANEAIAAQAERDLALEQRQAPS